MVSVNNKIFVIFVSMEIFIKILQIVVPAFVTYIMCGFIWSLIEWYVLMISSKKRYDNRPRGTNKANFVPDTFTRKSIVMTAMVQWPIRLLQFIVFNITGKTFHWLHGKTEGIYNKITDKVFK